MSKTVEFYFDFGSTTAYMAYKVLPKIAEKANAQIIYKPVLLGGVFKATNNVSPVSIKPKGDYMSKDLARFVAKYEIPFVMNPHFPINTLALMRGAIAYRDDAKFADYIEAVFNSMWVDGKNASDPEVLSEVLEDIGIGGADFVARINDPEVKQNLIAETEAAVARGMFGAPTMFVGNEMFFGQDRLHFVAEALGVNFLDVVPGYLAS